MVLDRHRQPLVLGIRRGALRHRPRLQDVADLQAEVVVQRGRGVLLHDEDGRLAQPVLLAGHRWVRYPVGLRSLRPPVG